ncbi:MAG: OB-fold domain-containing protein [Aigarchaeota archaeon]|nr:OB-fold domain-containing protein [Candidatus Pelearchaeum maunauluense]
MSSIVAYRCQECGHTSTIKRLRCRKCRGRAFVEVRLERGVLITYTVMNVVRPGYAKPLTIGVAEFGEGVKTLAQLAVNNPRVGMRVKPTQAALRKTEGGELLGTILKED